MNYSKKTIFQISAVLFGWLFLWFAPWPDWFETNLWIKVCIALSIFITPGAFLYLLLSQEATINLRFLTSGFVLSHLLMAILGTFGRVFHFSFAFAINIFMILGLILIVNHFLSKNRRIKKIIPSRSTIVGIFKYWSLAIIAGLTILMTIQRVITSDDLAYLAHLTNWQNMPNLNFSDVYFNSTEIESTRFWIVSSPYSQAFLAEIGDIPGLLLLNGHYEPYLSLISLICFYDLARTLGISRRLAMTSIILQVTFMALLSEYLHPGAPFFHQLSADKSTAAFIFTPVFISNAFQALNKPTKGSFTIFLLSGLSLTFLHPVISAFAVFIVSASFVFGISKHNYRNNLVLALLAVIVLTPQVGVRLIRHKAQPAIPTNIEDIGLSQGIESLVTRWDNAPFYGFNISILEMNIPYSDRLLFPAKFVSWIWIIIPISSAIISIKNLRESNLSQYILAASLLIALAGIPLTGWILGYFVSAWMLERTTWLYPFGISTVFILLTFWHHTVPGKQFRLQKLKIHKKLQIKLTTLTEMSIWLVSILLLILVMRVQGLPNINRLQSSTRRYRELVLLGQEIDKSSIQPVNVVGTDELNDFIPALTWKAKVISYRPEDLTYPYFYSEEEKLTRWSDRQAIFSTEIAPDERMEIIKKYNIRYIVLESYRFGKVKELVTTYPLKFNTYTFGRYNLIEINNLDSTNGS
ncbi:MAG: hypothetical protein PVJ21_11665 [Anaerolineales bacterium]